MSVYNPTEEIVIRPNQSWLHIDWRGIVQYKDLIMLMVRRDFLARYKQTILGPAWFIINPVLTSLTFTLVFSRVLGVATGGIPPVLFYLSGMLSWTYFSNLLSTSSNALLHNAALFGKVYFPRLIVPMAMAISSCVAFLIQLCTFLVVLTYFALSGKVDVSLPHVLVGIAMLPLIVVHAALLAVGLGLTMAAVTAKYRDFQHLTSFLLQLWMYLSPVIFPFTHVQERFPKLAWLAALNPMTAIIENVRYLFFATPPMPTPFLLFSIGFALIACAFGVLVFQRSARTFIDMV